MDKLIKIIICDDHPLIAEGVKSFIEHKEDLKIVAMVDSISALYQILEKETADILLLDISLPDGSGLDVCRDLKNKYGHLKIIALSNHNERSFIMKMLDRGASGYVIKSSSITNLEKAIREVHKGGIYLGEDVYHVLNSWGEMQVDIPPITKREKEVLGYIMEGYSSPQIAEKLHITSQTVDTHRKNLMAKFGVNKTINLIQKIKELGLE